MKKYIISILVFTLIISISCTETAQPKVTEETILSEITGTDIPDQSYNILEYGAKGDSTTNCKPFIDDAIAALKQNKGGKLTFPKGNYIVNGPIHFTNNMELHLEKGAKIIFGSNTSDYLPVVKTSWEGTFLYNYSPFIYAYQCNNIAITGQGTIDGEASETWATWKKHQKKDQLMSREMNHTGTPIKERQFGEGHFLRPHLVQFYDCKKIQIERVTIEDSPFWCVHLLQCENVIVRDVHFNAFNKNNDGIDPEYSKNVLIENVYFNNSDDNIAIKAGRDHEGRASKFKSENIIVRNCHFKGLHAIVIGSEMSAGVQNVFVHNCDFSGKVKRGVYLKSNPDRGGFMKNIYFKNLAFGEVEDLIYVTSYYHGEGEGFVTEISDIYLENITCEKSTGTGIVLQGFPDKKLSDMYLKNITIDSANNAISMTNTDGISMSNIIIGGKAGSPSFVK